MPQQPFPSWEFFSALPRVTTKDEDPDHRNFFWARNAIYHALGALRISPKAEALLPHYLCRAAVEPFLAYGMDVGFYQVGRNCEPNFEEIESKIGPRTEAVLAVHYFGFPQDIRAFRRLCDSRKLALIEDCAHVLTGQVSGRPLGSWGDASVFSWRKFLPLYDGSELKLKSSYGHLQVQWRGEPVAFTLKVAKNLADRILDESPHPLARSAGAAMDWLKHVWKSLPSNGAGSSPAPESNAVSFDRALLNQPMSRISHWLWRHSDFDAIIQRRRDNYHYLEAAFRKIEGLEPLHGELPPDTCPWVFPLSFTNLPKAHLLLRQRGIPAAAWDFVKHPMVESMSGEADFLYANLAFLPIHQNLTPKSLDLIIDAVKHVREATPIHDEHRGRV